MAGEMKVMPVESNFRKISEREVEKLKTPPSAPVQEALEEIAANRLKAEMEQMANQFLSAEMVEAMMKQMDMGKYIVEPKQSIAKKAPPKYIDALKAMEWESWGRDWKAEGFEIEPEPYKGANRVQLDVRLAERQIPEAMSIESKAFKKAIKRGLEKELLRALMATAGMGFIKEDWEVLRQSLIEMIAEQSRLYFRSADGIRDGTPEATITFEIPKMTMSFRMPLNPLDADDED